MGYSGAGMMQAIPSLISAAGIVAQQFQGSDSESADAKKMLESQARRKELDAMEAARRERQQAAKSAEQLCMDTQRLKARARAIWGKSGVSGSGSATRVLDGKDNDAENRISDIRDEAEQRAQYALAQGRLEASGLRGKASNYGKKVP